MHLQQTKPRNSESVLAQRQTREREPARRSGAVAENFLVAPKKFNYQVDYSETYRSRHVVAFDLPPALRCVCRGRGRIKRETDRGMETESRWIWFMLCRAFRQKSLCIIKFPFHSVSNIFVARTAKISYILHRPDMHNYYYYYDYYLVAGVRKCARLSDY